MKYTCISCFVVFICSMRVSCVCCIVVAVAFAIIIFVYSFTLFRVFSLFFDNFIVIDACECKSGRRVAIPHSKYVVYTKPHHEFAAWYVCYSCGILLHAIPYSKTTTTPSPILRSGTVFHKPSNQTKPNHTIQHSTVTHMSH